MTLDQSSRIQQLLIDEDFVSSQEIEVAVGLYNDRTKLSKLSFCMILSKAGHLDSSQVSHLINHSQSRDILVDVIAQKTGVSREDINNKTGIKTDTITLLKTLEKEGVITAAQSKKMLTRLLDDISTVRLAIELEFISEADASEAYSIKHFKKSICEILYEKNDITLRELNHVFRTLDDALKLGTILSCQDLITDEELSTALDNQKKSALSLGEILLKNRTITVAQLYFALSIQYNIPFRALNGFLYSDKQIVELRSIVNRSIAQQTEILPLLVNGNNLTVGVFNPGKVSNMNELMVIHPYIKINVTLITRNKFEQLFAILYGEIPTPQAENPGQKMAVDPGKKTVISAPFSEYRLISDLFDRYLTLSKQSDTKVDLSEKSIFHEFIYENYKSICSDYHCSHVAFWFELTEAKTQVMASPIMQSESTEISPFNLSGGSPDGRGTVF